MKSGLSLASSLAYVKSKRPMARPNAGFLKQLLAMEQQIFGEQSELPEELWLGVTGKLQTRLHIG